MKRLLLFLLPTFLFGQGYTLSVAGNPPSGLSNSIFTSSTCSTGCTGAYNYWIIVNFPVGSLAPFGPIAVNNAQNPPDGSHSITISWLPVNNATSYTVLRTAPNAQAPSQSQTLQIEVAACASITALTCTDLLTPALLNIKIPVAVQTVVGTIVNNNVNFSVPSFVMNQPIANLSIQGFPSFATGFECLHINPLGLISPTVGADCNTGGGGAVSSISGDGTLITNSGSTGAVTLTTGSASAHTWWGNAGSGTGFNALTAADIPSISLTTGVTGILPVANGGTGTGTAIAGQVFNTTSPTAGAYTSNLQLGVSGTASSIIMGNATSGLFTLTPPTGVLSSMAAGFPSNTNAGVVAETNVAGGQTFTTTQTMSNGLAVTGGSFTASVTPNFSSGLTVSAGNVGVTSGTLTLSALGGTTQCMESVAGVLTGTGSTCGGGSGASNFTQLNDAQVAIASATFTIGTNCTVGLPCTAGFGPTTTQAISAGTTFTQTVGTSCTSASPGCVAYVWETPSGGYDVGLDTNWVNSGITCSPNCTVLTSVTGFPLPTSASTFIIPIAKVTSINTGFNTTVDERAFNRQFPVWCGTGLICTAAANNITLTPDPTYSPAPATITLSGTATSAPKSLTCVQYTVTVGTDLTAASGTQTITLASSFPANWTFVSATNREPTQFGGGGMTSATVSIGTSGSPQGILPNVALMQTGDPVSPSVGPGFSLGSSSGVAVIATYKDNGGTWSTATTGVSKIEACGYTAF